jgi:O-antigen biosynthesis protein WbqP
MKSHMSDIPTIATKAGASLRSLPSGIPVEARSAARPLWKCTIDLALGSVLALAALPLCVLCWIAVRCTSRGPALHWSRRVGRNNSLFYMPKFRSMNIDTPQVATHLLESPNIYVTPVGRLLRKTSLDELPQLFSVLKGDLSLVGPRPALFNQDDLIALRTEAGVHRLTPGITGLAQVNGRDDLEIPIKVQVESEYMRIMSPLTDLKIVFLTIFKVLRMRGVHH